MADWIFNQDGQATLIHSNDCFRDRNGRVIAWISGDNVFSLQGQHRGWFEGGVLYDDDNQALGFSFNSTGYLPSRPGIGGTPGMPGFSGYPGRPGFSGIPGKPGRGGWSSYELASYFNT